MAQHSSSTSMHVNPVAQSYKPQAEGEDKRLIEPVETEVSVSEMKENENKCLGSSFIKTVLATQL